MIDAIPYLAAVLLASLAASALLAGGPITHVLTRWRGVTFLTLLPYCMMALAAVSIATSGRELGAILVSLGSSDARHPLTTWLTRFTSVGLVASSLHLVVTQLSGSKVGTDRWMLISAFSLLWLTTTLSPALAGANRVLSHEYFYCLTIGLGLTVMPLRAGDRLIQDARNAIVFFTLLGMLVIPVRPAMVLDLGYVRGLLPGVPRFAGFAPHPVAMGLISVVGLLCWSTHRFARRWQNAAAVLILLAGLILAQSKTAWIASLLAIGGMHAVAVLRALFTRPWQGTHRFVLIGALAIVMAMALVALGLTVFDVLPSKIDSFTRSAAGAQLLSLTGRDQIWTVALEEWRRHPLFGYGPTLFDEAYRLSIGMPFAMHGHNELIDTLGRSGLIGGVGVVVYYLTLTVWAMKVARPTRGLSVALWILVTLQCVSEIPLQLFRYGPENLPHFLLLGVVASHIAGRRAALPRAVEARAAIGRQWPLRPL